MHRLLLLATITLATTAQAEPNPYLREAKILYEEFSFTACAQRLDLAAKWPSSSDELVQVSLYAALCAYNLNKLDDAKNHFRTAVRLDPKVELPAMTSPKVRQFFDTVPRLAAPPADAPIAAPAPTPEPVPEPAPVAEAPTSPAAAALPPEAPPAPMTVVAQPSTAARVAAIALTVLTAAMLGTSAGLGLNAQRLAAAANGAAFDSDRSRLGTDAYARATQTNVGWGLSGALAIAAAVCWVLSW